MQHVELIKSYIIGIFCSYLFPTSSLFSPFSSYMSAIYLISFEKHGLGQMVADIKITSFSVLKLYS